MKTASWELIKKVLELSPFKSTYNELKKYIHDERILGFLCFQAMYIGVSPFKGSNIYATIPMVSQLFGLILIRGGMRGYVEGLEKLFKEMGGVIHKNIEIDGILTQKYSAVGIRSREKIFLSQIVVSNAGYPYTQKKLIKEEFYDRRCEKFKYSPGVFILYLGTGEKYPQLGVHNILLGEDYKKSIQGCFNGVIPKELSLYIYVPTRKDQSLASKGGECINIMVRVPNLKQMNIEWNEEEKKNMRDRIIEELKSLKGLEDIENNIEVERYFTPKDMKEKFNNLYGEAFSISHTLTQSNFFRPHIKDKKIKSMYYCGESTYPGTGISLVLMNSKIVSEQICQDFFKGEKYT